MRKTFYFDWLFSETEFQVSGHLNNQKKLDRCIEIGLLDGSVSDVCDPFI